VLSKKIPGRLSYQRKFLAACVIKESSWPLVLSKNVPGRLCYQGNSLASIKSEIYGNFKKGVELEPSGVSRRK
jgi:hypothetical protein